MEKEGYPADAPATEMKGSDFSMMAENPPQYHEGGFQQQYLPGYPNNAPGGHPYGAPSQSPPMGAPQGPPMGVPQGSYPQQPHSVYAPSPQAPAGYATNTQQTVVIQQGLAPTEYVESYLAWSIINCLCCCWILGIIAIIMSCMARSDNDAGNVNGARMHAKAAFGLNAAGTLIGVIVIIVFVALRYS